MLYTLGTQITHVTVAKKNPKKQTTTKKYSENDASQPYPNYNILKQF